MRPLVVFGLVLAGAGMILGGVGATGAQARLQANPLPPRNRGMVRRSPRPAPLPEGNNGIARKYPGDAKIAGDPAVIFADDFEGYAKAEDLGKR